MKSSHKLIALLLSLAALMAFTRSSHFGSSIHLPDASLAVFLIAGFLLPRFNLLALAVFGLFLLEAGSVDYYAIHMAGVNDYCFTPAYWFLIPTYAAMWLGGRWIAQHQQNSVQGALQFAGVAALSTTLAFIISNASFYLLSGKFAEMGAFDYATAVSKYFAPYFSSSMMYLAIAALIYAASNRLFATRHAH